MLALELGERQMCRENVGKQWFFGNCAKRCSCLTVSPKDCRSDILRQTSFLAGGIVGAYLGIC